MDRERESVRGREGAKKGETERETHTHTHKIKKNTQSLKYNLKKINFSKFFGSANNYHLQKNIIELLLRWDC